ncbi:hypothetical protein [uncultured Shewanella sp.]|uniref:RCC1 domain-containing protein n=1 Tax=uncultured Shewanella sp. TaxID=173975 RepID=UPI00260EF259|nr:hypothetical protein [uncultured Shewanella sp.]
MQLKHLILPALSVLASGMAHANFNIEATSTASTVIPVDGGNLEFDLKIKNEFTEDKDISYFNYLIFPDGKHYNIDAPLDLTLMEGEQFESPNHAFNIPNWFPSGNYTYRFSMQDKSTGKLYLEEFIFNKEAKGIRLFGAGASQTCAQDDLGIQCWGDRGKYTDQGLYNIPSLSEVIEVSLGYGFSCALEKESNRPNCWGDFASEFSEPYLVNPRNMVSAYRHSCAIVDSAEKIACWGVFTDGVEDVPVTSLDNPIQVSTAPYHSCALNQPTSGNNFVKCWGNSKYVQVPAHTNPSFIASGSRASCMIDQGEVVCWGMDGYYPETSPALSNPVSVVVYRTTACALDDNGLTCWDKTADNIIDAEDISQLSNPTQIVLSYNQKCAVDDEGIKCWGPNADKDPVPARFIFPAS